MKGIAMTLTKTTKTALKKARNLLILAGLACIAIGLIVGAVGTALIK